MSELGRGKGSLRGMGEILFGLIEETANGGHHEDCDVDRQRCTCAVHVAEAALRLLGQRSEAARPEHTLEAEQAYLRGTGPRTAEAPAGHGAIELSYGPTEDTEITCLVCSATPCAFEIRSIDEPCGCWDGEDEDAA